MTDALKVTIEPINYQLNVQDDHDFLDYVKKKLLGTSVYQGEKTQILMLGAYLPLFIKKTLPSGEVTITKDTIIEVLNTFVHPEGEYHRYSITQTINVPKGMEHIMRKVQDHEQRIDKIS